MSPLTPLSYYEEQAAAVAQYVAWVTTPRERPTPEHCFKLKPQNEPSLKSIKAHILNGI